MASYTIANEVISDEILSNYYACAKRLYTVPSWNDLDLIFQVALRNRDRFPGINVTGQQNPESYIEKFYGSFFFIS